MTAARYRPVRFGGSLSATVERRADGSLVLRSTEALKPYPARLTDRLLHWAAAAPERTLVARRVEGGDWHRVSFAQALASARSIAQALIERGLSPERPVAVLSENSIDHFLLMLGSMFAGVPIVPVSPAYSLLSQDHSKLKHILGVATPGLVFASHGTPYGRAIHAAVAADAEVVLGRGELEGRRCTPFGELLAARPTDAVERRHAEVGPDTVAKLLFTSGSTKLPKGVINTHRMLASNQQSIAQCFPELEETPPVLVDWLPWNHTFGGNHNTGIVLYHGGTLYIDDGKPTPQGIGETLRNLREVAPTVYFNVPKGFEEIAKALEVDAQLRRTFFSRVKFCFFAGAGLAQPVWDRLDAVAEQEIGERIRMITGLGMTETAPFGICANRDEVKSGYLGLPAPGWSIKVVPVGEKLECRYLGPSLTPGYWRNPEQTADSYDEEGYFRSGDAVLPIVPGDWASGMKFDGRTAEDFKLATGTFVSVGPLRAKVIAEGAPYVQDAVVAGLNRDDVAVLVFPRLDDCRDLARMPASATPAEVLAAPAVRDFFQQLADRLWATGTGSASRVARLRVLEEPPSIDAGEVTDKGSINQRAVLARREALVDAVYAGTDAAALVPEARR
ncbi:MAG TPA: feruloyl-CoA synthase [Burkholderiaceae bacterium]